MTVPIIVDQAVGYCSGDFESGCLLLLDEAVGYCSHYFGSGCWLLFHIFWIRLLITVPINLDQAAGYSPLNFGSAGGYCSHNFGPACWSLFPFF